MSCPRISKKYSARLDFSVRSSFSRSEALSCAAYCASRTVLRTLPHRSGSHEASSGNDRIVLCSCGGEAPVPLLETGVVLRFPEVRERVYEGAVASVGKYCDRASRTTARASM